LAMSADEQATQAARDFNESLASNGQELTEAGFELARHAARSKDAKGFVMAAGGVKVFATMARTAMGMDQVEQINAAKPLAVIYWRPEMAAAPAKAEPIDITPPAAEESIDLDFA